jgi:predicted GNAT family N-acyltransferase
MDGSAVIRSRGSAAYYSGRTSPEFDVPAEISVRILPWAEARGFASAIREAVFVAEQRVPPEIELDEWDERCDHALAYEAHGRPVGTGRLLPDGHIGRMAVLREYRGRGVGAAILASLVERAKTRGMRQVLLNAQTQAAGFYARFGFAVSGEPFMEAGIPHVEMARDLASGRA